MEARFLISSSLLTRLQSTSYVRTSTVINPLYLEEFGLFLTLSLCLFVCCLKKSLDLKMAAEWKN